MTVELAMSRMYNIYEDEDEDLHRIGHRACPSNLLPVPRDPATPPATRVVTRSTAEPGGS